MIVNRALAEYIPDEDDPKYVECEKAFPQFQATMEQRYPQVCENCIERVQARIWQAGYEAKAAAVRRKLEQSKKYHDKTRTPRQLVTLAIIWVGRCAYLCSLAATFIWHALGAAADFGHAEHKFDLRQCLLRAAYSAKADQVCVVSPTAQKLMSYVLIADALSFWWNPLLSTKMKHANARMRGLYKVWTIRISMLLLNVGTWFILGDGSFRENGPVVQERVDLFHHAHAVLFAIQFFATWIGWKAVTIYYVSVKELLRPLDAHLPTAPNSNETTPRRDSKPLPNHTSFDSMAAGFASNSLFEPNAYYSPPSPTLTVVSTATTAEDSDFTGWRRDSSATTGDEMDWTPTKPRFAPHAPSLLPSRYNRPPSAGREPSMTSERNIFKPGFDANPFRRRVPAAPKAPIAKIVDPWRRPSWQPDPLERTRNLFEEDKERNAKLGTGLHGKGVPRTVEREAQLFEPPKFKFDAEAYGGADRETGLEDTFNDLFSK